MMRMSGGTGELAQKLQESPTWAASVGDGGGPPRDGRGAGGARGAPVGRPADARLRGATRFSTCGSCRRPCGTSRMHVGAFLVVAAVIVVTPGVDMALVTKNALLHGRRAALATAWGSTQGSRCGRSPPLGLAAIVRESATAFTAVKLAGAAYLVYLGLHSLSGPRAGTVASNGPRSSSDRSTRGTPTARAPQQPPEPEGRRVLHEPAAAVVSRRGSAAVVPPPRGALRRARGRLARALPPRHFPRTRCPAAPRG
jgi:LysE type translocator